MVLRRQGSTQALPVGYREGEALYLHSWGLWLRKLLTKELPLGREGWVKSSMPLPFCSSLTQPSVSLSKPNSCLGSAFRVPMESCAAGWQGNSISSISQVRKQTLKGELTYPRTHQLVWLNLNPNHFMSNVILSLCSLLLLKEILRILPAPISHLSILKLLAELMTYFVPQRFRSSETL